MNISHSSSLFWGFFILSSLKWLATEESVDTWLSSISNKKFGKYIPSFWNLILSVSAIREVSLSSREVICFVREALSSDKLDILSIYNRLSVLVLLWASTPGGLKQKGPIQWISCSTKILVIPLRFEQLLCHSWMQLVQERTQESGSCWPHGQFIRFAEADFLVLFFSFFLSCTLDSIPPRCVRCLMGGLGMGEKGDRGTRLTRGHCYCWVFK